jgi:hypothetical protein
VLGYSKAAMARMVKVSMGVPTKVQSKRLIKVRCRRHLHTTRVCSKAPITLRILNGSRTMMTPQRITTVVDFQENLAEEALSPAKAINNSKIKYKTDANSSSNNKIISKIPQRLVYASLQ